MSSDLDLFPDHPQTHCKHGTWLKEDICLSCQQERERAIRDDERGKIAEWLRSTCCGSGRFECGSCSESLPCDMPDIAEKIDRNEHRHE